MKNIFILIILLVSQLNYAQFAQVNDSDGFVNVRKDATAISEIVGKISDKEIVYFLMTEVPVNNWEYAVYEDKSKKDISGYIHSSRLKKLSDFMEVNYFKTANNTAFF